MTAGLPRGAGEVADLRVEVRAEPLPGLLRPALEAVLAGGAWPAGPEADVAAAVAAHVAARPGPREEPC